MKGEYTISEVSKLLKVSTRTIHSYIKKGKLKAYKKDNKLYFIKEQFNEKEALNDTSLKESEVIKELKSKIVELKQDKEKLEKSNQFFQDHLIREQRLRQQDIDKIDKVLQLNFPSQDTDLEAKVYEAQPIKQDTKKKPSKKQHNRTTQPIRKKATKKGNTNNKKFKLQSYSKNDKIKSSKHKKGFFNRLFKG